MSGKWIVFEGLDGAGTTTQIELLSRRLEEAGIPSSEIYRTAEPTQGPLGAMCRQALRGELDLDPLTLALTFAADRSHHVHKPGGVLSRLKKNHWVLMDRYLYSTLAYQHAIDADWLDALHRLFPRPDMVFFIDTPVSECLDRIERRGAPLDIYEEETYLTAVREKYRILERKEGHHTRWHEISGVGKPGEIADKIWKMVSETFPI